ncbi:uncharacterized protein LOC106014239 [Aplysia californica]|uniref:Uncharacterized protein LOC106014239 n=1 Tax=Aplysia californica TaxID=6500 RepID=A0ABM1AG42_APLCA|nr:uncharacterized protein LOC106014239 [Aplysia californica]
MGPGNGSQTTLPESVSKGIVSAGLLNIFVITFYVAATGTISFSGIIFNIINIIVFLKQGLKDSVNITLFSMAISDTGSLMGLFYVSISFNPWLVNADLPFDPLDLQHLAGGWVHILFARITSWITAFVTFERCLCIALPLKVKNIITPRRTIVVVVSIYLTMLAFVAPVYYSTRLGPKFFPEKNKTMIGLLYVLNGPSIEKVSLALNVLAQFGAFFAVIICTVILVHNLLLKSKWRQSTSSSAKQESLSQRDKKVVKIVLLISTIFIFCFFPGAVSFIAMSTVNGFNVNGRYHNIFLLTWSMFKTLQATNSTVNIFIYYNMSSKYKEILDEMLHRKKGNID